MRKRRVVAEDLVWGGDQARAMKELKEALISVPALKLIVYTPEEDGFVGGIVLGVDACRLGFSAILQQEDREQRRHPVWYKSGLWTPAETRYDAVKLECRGVLRPLWLSPGCGIPVVAHWVSWHLSCCPRAPS